MVDLSGSFAVDVSRNEYDNRSYLFLFKFAEKALLQLLQLTFMIASNYYPISQ